MSADLSPVIGRSWDVDECLFETARPRHRALNSGGSSFDVASSFLSPHGIISTWVFL